MKTRKPSARQQILQLKKEKAELERQEKSRQILHDKVIAERDALRRHNEELREKISLRRRNKMTGIETIAVAIDIEPLHLGDKEYAERQLCECLHSLGFAAGTRMWEAAVSGMRRAFESRDFQKMEYDWMMQQTRCSNYEHAVKLWREGLPILMKFVLNHKPGQS